MKSYTKADVKHVLEEFNSELNELLEEVSAGRCFNFESVITELSIGIKRLNGMLQKPEEEWSFDDYMAFYKIKEYLV